MADAVLSGEDRHFTYADYKGWELDEGERFEVIDGVAYAMSAPNANHQLILVAVAAEFYNFFKGKPCKVYVAPYDVRLFYREDESDDTVVQPDLSVVCDEKKQGYEGCRGAPDLVVEILSPSNTAIEMDRKFELYRRAGVREYWILNPDTKTILIHHFKEDQIAVQTHGPADSAAAGIFPGLSIPVETIFAESTITAP
jgi:Uma2 family endonuclease